MADSVTAEPRATPLAGRRVLVGVTGGIAAYKAAELVRLLGKAGADVRCVMTRAATEFLKPLTLEALTKNRVHTELFTPGQESAIGHIELAEWAELIVIAPASADAIARIAAGMADDLLTTLLLVARCPVLLAPAMNAKMWAHELVQANVATLTALGRVHVVGPGDGWLACRVVGPGRLAEPADITEAAGRLLTTQDLAGKSILVTAGPTHEPLDPARVLANRSTGKMGFAIARAAAARGARVTLIAGPTSLEPPLGVDVVRIETARELHAAVLDAWKGADAVIMTAAVADFRPREAARQKLKKEALGETPSLALARNPDVLADLGKRRGRAKKPMLIGFAAETTDVEANAKKKLASKKCDLVVANDVSLGDAGFAVDTNRLILVDADGATATPLLSKDGAAHVVLDRATGASGTRPRTPTPRAGRS